MSGVGWHGFAKVPDADARARRNAARQAFGFQGVGTQFPLYPIDVNHSENTYADALMRLMITGTGACYASALFVDQGGGTQNAWMLGISDQNDFSLAMSAESALTTDFTATVVNFIRDSVNTDEVRMGVNTAQGSLEEYFHFHATRDGADSTLVVANDAASGSTDETAGFKMRLKSGSLPDGAAIVAGREDDYSTTALSNGYLAFQTAYQGALGERFRISSTGDLTFTSAFTASPYLTIKNTNADATSGGIKFVKDSASPADNDDLGQLQFLGDDSGGTQTTFGTIVGESSDVTDTTEAGKYTFNLLMNGTSRQFLIMNAYNGTADQGEFIVNEDGQDIDFRVEASGVAAALQVLGSSGAIRFGALTTNGVVTTSGGTGTLAVVNPLPISNGGTGATSLASGYIPYSSGGTAYAASPAYTDGTNIGLGVTTLTHMLHMLVAGSESAVRITNTGGAGGMYLTGLGGNYGAVTAGARSDSSNTWYATDIVASGILMYGGALYFFTDSSLTNGVSFTPTSQVTIANDGSITMGVAAATSLACPTFTTASGAMGFTPASGSNFNITLATTGDLVVNTTQFVVDTSAASVGVGTAWPSTQLHVSGSAAITTTFESSSTTGSFIRLTKTDATDRSWDLGATGSAAGAGDNKLALYDATAAAYRLVVDSSGYLGVNNTSPAVRLESLDASAAQLRLTHTAASKFCNFTVDTNHDITVTPSSTGQVILKPTSNSTDFFMVQNASGGTVLQVGTTNGRVGVGAAAENFTFEVAAPAGDTYMAHYGQTRTLALVRFQNDSTASTSNLSGFDYRLNTSAQVRTATRLTASFTNTTDATRESAFILSTCQSPTLTEAWRLQGKNMGLNSSSFGSGASGVFAIGNGTQGAALANAIQIVSEDLSAGNTILSIQTEGSGAFASGTPSAAAGAVVIKLNGTVYYLTASTSAPT